MLVEDDNSLREIYQARLAAEGYETVTAKDGEEALALVAKEKPDLIILDVMMPKISGFDTLDILKSTPATKDTKIIMMSALSQAEDKARAEKLGANRYLVKSQVTLEDIVKSVKEVLEGGAAPAAPANPTDPTTAPADSNPAPTDPAATPSEPAQTVDPAPVASTTTDSTTQADTLSSSDVSTPATPATQTDSSQATDPLSTTSPPLDSPAIPAIPKDDTETTTQEQTEVTQQIDEFAKGDSTPTEDTTAAPDPTDPTPAITGTEVPETPDPNPDSSQVTSDPSPLSDSGAGQTGDTLDKTTSPSSSPSPTPSINLGSTGTDPTPTSTPPVTIEPTQPSTTSVPVVDESKADEPKEVEPKESASEQLAGGTKVIQPLETTGAEKSSLDELLAKEAANGNPSTPTTAPSTEITPQQQTEQTPGQTTNPA